MSKEHAYAYEAGYRDGSIHYELEHCPACKNVADLQEALEENVKLRDGANAMRQLYEDELKHALTENAKLREQVDAAHMSRLLTENENASLRELVAKYSAAAKYLCGFSHCNECNLDCASVFGDVPSGWDCARMLLDKKARELGVEVGA